MSYLQLRHLSKRFTGPEGRFLHAVRDVCLDVPRGEQLVLMGPSASGKTTLLRLIAGLETADAGQVRFAGQEWTGMPPHRRDVAMVFQNRALYPHLTAAQNIGLGLRLRRVPAAEIARRVAGLAERLDLTAALSRRPFELSGGQQQRVALARALIRQPSLLLLDEPLSQLDGALRRQLCLELNTLHAEFRLTTLIVTHQLDEAEALGDRVAVMHEGRLEQVGSPAELRAHPATPFVAECLRPGLL